MLDDWHQKFLGVVIISFRKLTNKEGKETLMQLRTRGREPARRNDDRRREQQRCSETAEQRFCVRRVQLPAGENDGIWSLQQSQVCSSCSYRPKSRHQNHQQREDERHGRQRCESFSETELLFLDILASCSHFHSTVRLYPLYLV